MLLPDATAPTTARLAGGGYLLTIVLGMTGELLGTPWLSDLATLLSFGTYVGVTLLLYRLFARASPRWSRVAAVSSLVGCLLGGLRVLHRWPFPPNPLVFFGLYCLLLGGMGWQARLLPRWLSGLLALAGLGWLTFLVPHLAPQLSPYTLVSGLVGEGALALWLLLARRPLTTAYSTYAATTSTSTRSAPKHF